MRLALLAIVCVTACAGTTNGGDVAPPPHPAAATPESPPERRFALVWGNAYVYEAPSPDAKKARVRSFPDNARNDNVGAVWPVEVLDDDVAGDMVKIRTLGGEDAGHCHRGPSFLHAFAVELYVSRDDLAPVTSAPTAGAFEDGTWVAVRPGVAVSPKRTAVVDGLRVPLPAAAEVGSTYSVAPRFDTRRIEQQTRSPLFVGGVEIEEDALTSVPVWRTDDGVGGVNVSVVTGCVQALARAPTAPQLVPHHPVDARDAASPNVPKSAKHFGTGTPLTFRDGRPAGKTVDAMASVLHDEVGDRLCFQRSLTDPQPGDVMPEHHTLDLCVPASDAREQAQPRAAWTVPTIRPLEPPR
jgi:hypothetical protein